MDCNIAEVILCESCESLACRQGLLVCRLDSNRNVACKRKYDRRLYFVVPQPGDFREQDFVSPSRLQVVYIIDEAS